MHYSHVFFYQLDDKEVVSYQSASYLFMSAFLFISVTISFSRGRPFRTPMYRNRSFMCAVLFLIGMNVFLMFGVPLELLSFMKIRKIPDDRFLMQILLLFGCHLMICSSFEMFCIENSSFRSCAIKRFYAFVADACCVRRKSSDKKAL